MTFTFHLTEEDMTKLNFWHWEKGLFKIRVMLSLLVGVTVFFALRIGYKSNNILVEIVAALIIALGGFLFTGSKWYRNYYLKVLEKDTKKRTAEVAAIAKVLTQHQISFEEEIKDSYANEERVFAYEEFSQLEEDDYAVFIRMNNKKVVMLPLRVFESESQKEELKTFLANKKVLS